MSCAPENLEFLDHFRPTKQDAMLFNDLLLTCGRVFTLPVGRAVNAWPNPTTSAQDSKEYRVVFVTKI